MQKYISLLTMLLFGLLPTVQADSVKKCQLANVSGTINTTVITDTLQVGIVDVTLTSPKGKVLFEETGGIIGKITFSNPDLGLSILEHSMIFADGSRVETDNDVAQITGFCPDGRLQVFETIKTIAWGNGRFKRAFIQDDQAIFAEGCISSFPGGQNDLTLSGSLCIR